MDIDRHVEDYLVLILSDSNLPTGGFIASAGLESYYSHGFLTSQQQQMLRPTLAFVEHSLANYAASVMPYMCAAYQLTQMYLDGDDRALDALCRLDWHHHTVVLNHVARRASMIQGMASLTLYMRSFAPASEGSRANALIEALRKRIRKGGASLASGALALPAEQLAGHLPICTGVFSRCVGLSLARMVHLNLFLQARNLMSCSIRLNTLGPYLAHQLLATQLRELVDSVQRKMSADHSDKLCRFAMQSSDEWLDDADDEYDADVVCTTWPLGEIVQARHDQLHSRLFNS